jgi:hypothetical protein
VSLVRYEPGFYIPKAGILHGVRRNNLKCLSKIYFNIIFCIRFLNGFVALKIEAADYVM